MNTEDDFQRQLDADPDDWQTRLVFADWLQDRDDPRADGYRALAIQGKYAVRFQNPTRAVFWNAEKYGRDTQYMSSFLPGDWYALTTESPGSLWRRWESRREAEDAAALAFAKLPAARRAELLNAGVAA